MRNHLPINNFPPTLFSPNRSRIYERRNYYSEHPGRQVQGGAALFAIDFNDGAGSMAGVMRAPLCVVNERRQQMAGLCQAHPQVRPERAVFKRVHLAASGAPSMVKAHLGAAATGPRAVPGSQRLLMRNGDRTSGALPAGSNMLRAGDGSRSVLVGHSESWVAARRCAPMVA
jgi:hypothetical protein